MTTTIDRVANAMEARRRELIAKPLASIWPELAKAAVAAMREPSDAIFRDVYDMNSADYIANNLELVWCEIIDAILNEGEGK